MATTVDEQIQVQLSFRRAHSSPISGLTGSFGIGRMLATELRGEQYGCSRRGGLLPSNRGSSLMRDFGVWPVAAIAAIQQYGCYWRESCHLAGIANRSLMTQSDTSLPSIAALQNVC